LNFFEKYWSPGLPGLPKYAHLREILRTAIQHGYWKAGDKLPTEIELTRLTPFSLGTVQRALRSLTEEGLVMRLQGNGTFVAEERRAIDSPLHCRFLDDDGVSYLPIFPKALSCNRIGTAGPWSDYLGQDGDNIICVARRLDINGEFNVYSRFYLNADRFGSIVDQPLSSLDRVTLKTLLSGEFNLPITRMVQGLIMTKFSRDVAKVIGVSPGTTGFMLESVASAGLNNHVYYLESFIPPNRRKLVVSDDSPTERSQPVPRHTARERID
jgi:DNA-binding GntR family transcriptional regulator